jgi:hypothetical protein
MLFARCLASLFDLVCWLKINKVPGTRGTLFVIVCVLFRAKEMFESLDDGHSLRWCGQCAFQGTIVLLAQGCALRAVLSTYLCGDIGLRRSK